MKNLNYNKRTKISQLVKKMYSESLFPVVVKSDLSPPPLFVALSTLLQDYNNLLLVLVLLKHHTSLLASSDSNLFQTCHNNWEQAVRTSGANTFQHRLDNNVVTTYVRISKNLGIFTVHCVFHNSDTVLQKTTKSVNRVSVATQVFLKSMQSSERRMTDIIPGCCTRETL